MKAYSWILLFLCAFSLGIAYQFFSRQPQEGEPLRNETSPTLTLPEGDIASDGFSLKLLQAALRANRGNILLTPRPLAATLTGLRPLCTGESAAALDALAPPPPPSSTPSSPEPESVSVLFGDITLDGAALSKADRFIRIPFSSQPAESINLINNLLSEQTEGRMSHLVDGENVNAETQLLSITGAVLEGEWLLPIHPEQTRPGDFFNGDGGMPRVSMMTCSGPLRLARAEDGSWQAVALFLRRTSTRADSTCFVAILPQGNSARAFARDLTPGTLSDIRSALAHATPVDASVTLPRLPLRSPTQNLRPLFRQLGLSSLLTPQANLDLRQKGGSAEAKPVRLSAALQLCAVPLTETVDPEGQASRWAAPPENSAAKESLTLDRPFLWFVGDLTSPTPPWFMGVIENL